MQGLVHVHILHHRKRKSLLRFLFNVLVLASLVLRIRYSLGLVQQIINSQGLDRHVFNGWWERFCQQQPSITLHVPMGLSHARAFASDRAIIDEYNQNLIHILIDNHLLDSLFNCDETGLPLSPKSFKKLWQKRD